MPAAPAVNIGTALPPPVDYEPSMPAAPVLPVVDLPVYAPDLTGYSSAPSSQDFRDEVEALL